MYIYICMYKCFIFYNIVCRYFHVKNFYLKSSRVNDATICVTHHIHTVQLPLFVQLVFSKSLLYWPFKYYINCLFPYKIVSYTHVCIIYIIPLLLYGGRSSHTKMRLPYSVSVSLDGKKIVSIRICHTNSENGHTPPCRIRELQSDSGIYA